MGMREKAGEITLCENVREKRAKCGSLPPNAGGLATIQHSVLRLYILLIYNQSLIFEEEEVRFMFASCFISITAFFFVAGPRLHGSDRWTCLTLTDPPQTPSLVVILIDEMTYRRQ